jgi:hypothetical protein
MGNLCCAREHSVQFFVQFFTQLNLECMRSFTPKISIHVQVNEYRTIPGIASYRLSYPVVSYSKQRR